MIFAQAAAFDPSKSFNGHGLLTLGAIGILILIVSNIDKIWKLFLSWKNRQTIPTTNESDTVTFQVNEPEEEVTEAEYRVMLFGWVDEIRSYAVETGNDKALATANTLINDLLATTPSKEITHAKSDI